MQKQIITLASSCVLLMSATSVYAADMSTNGTTGMSGDSSSTSAPASVSNPSDSNASSTTSPAADSTSSSQNSISRSPSTSQNTQSTSSNTDSSSASQSANSQNASSPSTSTDNSTNSASQTSTSTPSSASNGSDNSSTTSQNASQTNSTDSSTTSQNASQTNSTDNSSTASSESGDNASSTGVYRWKVPYRNSANTMTEFRSANTTPSPANLDATLGSNIPVGTTFTATLATALYSEYNQPGDHVLAIIDHPLVDPNGVVVAPAGSKLLGKVSKVSSRNESGKNAKLMFSFHEIITPTGQRIPFHADIANSDNGMLLGGQNKLEGVVYRPADRSIAALQNQINTAEGSWYGTAIGKAFVLSEPMAHQLSTKPVDAMDVTPRQVMLGVGDTLNLRVEAMTQ